jgi:hypothetical protein
VAEGVFVVVLAVVAGAIAVGCGYVVVRLLRRAGRSTR